MISNDIKKLLVEMKETPYRAALIVLLDEELNKMSEITTFTGTTEQKGAQIEARQEAAKIIKKIFGFLDYQPSRDKPRSQYL